MKLEIYQSTWAMEQRQSGVSEWDFTEKCRMAREAGYDGLNIDLDSHELPPHADLKSILHDTDLDCSIVAFPDNIDSLQKSLDAAAFLSSTALVVNARFFPLQVEAGAQFVDACLSVAKAYPFPTYFETHRLTLTNDLLFTVQLLDACADLKLVADVSHYVLGREMPMPLDTFHDELIKIIFSHSNGLQGRIASREQIQVQSGFAQHKQWHDQFMEWWRWAMDNWRGRASTGDVLNFTCELGPSPYAMTDQNGKEFSDRWQEALQMKKTIELIWQSLGEDNA